MSPLVRIIFLVCLFRCATACAYEGPVFTHRSLRVYVEGAVEVNPKDVARVWDSLTLWWQKLHGDDWGNIEWTVTFQDEKVECAASKVGWCYGITWLGARRSIVWVQDPCLARTALLHELIHAFEYMSTGNGDNGHKSVELWKIAGGEASLEAWGQDDLAKQMLCW